MTVLVADQPGTNSYLASLIEAYKSAGVTVICGLHNFFYSNLVPDILHIQWPEKLYGWYPFSALSKDEKIKMIEDRLNWYRQNNTIIVHTIHNIKPHITLKTEFEDYIFNLIIDYSDILCHHCSKSINFLKEEYPQVSLKKNVICRHGNYLVDYKFVTKSDARLKLGIPEDKFVILNFGSQQIYKGEEFIESVFRKLPISNKYLLTAGDYRFGGYSLLQRGVKEIKNLIRKRYRHNKKYIFRIINPDEICYFFSASDIVFLAHKNSLNSGILPLAATYEKPVVFPDTGCFKEQMEDWTYESYENNNLKQAINSVMKLHNRIKIETFSNSSWLEQNDWKKHVEAIINIIAEKTNN